MAAHTISGQRWANGTTVSVYPANSWPDPSRAPSGAAVTTAAVSGGAVTFTGLSERVRYVAYAAGVGVTFTVPQVDPMDARSLRDRVDELAGDTVANFTAPSTVNAVAPINDVVGWKFAPRSSSGTADSVQFANTAGTVKAGFKSDGVFYSKAGSQFGSAAGPSSTQYTGTGTSGPGGTPSSDIPWTLFHYFGQSGTVPGTTQGGSVIVKYFNKTLDDSAEAFSAGAFLVDSGTPFTQTLPVVGLEGDFTIQGANTLSNKGIGVTAGVFIQNTAVVTTAIHFYAALTNVAAGASLTNAYAFYDEGVSGVATNAWTLFGSNTVQTSGRLVVGSATTTPASCRAFILGASDATDSVGTLVVQAASGQTAASIVIRDSGGTQRGQWFGSTGNLLVGNGATGGSGLAILSMKTAGAPSGTPPAGGAYWYVDPADNKAKIKTSGGTVTILTPVI